VPGNGDGLQPAGLLAFSSVSVRGGEVFRCRPQQGFGLCRHAAGRPVQVLDEAAAIASPVLVKDAGRGGGLDGVLRVVPLAKVGRGPSHAVWPGDFRFGRRVRGCAYFGCEDGYCTCSVGAESARCRRRPWSWNGPAARSGGEPTASSSDWFTSFGNWANTNTTRQNIKPPLALHDSRYEGTVKHLSVCGGGRLYTHTAEGQIFAVEQASAGCVAAVLPRRARVVYVTVVLRGTTGWCRRPGWIPVCSVVLTPATGKLLWEAPSAVRQLEPPAAADRAPGSRHLPIQQRPLSPGRTGCLNIKAPSAFPATRNRWSKPGSSRAGRGLDA